MSAPETGGGDDMDNDVIFEPLRFRNLTVKNRIFRSSISGRWDNYNGSGTQARINWETKFARGGCEVSLGFCDPFFKHFVHRELFHDRRRLE